MPSILSAAWATLRTARSLPVSIRVLLVLTVVSLVSRLSLLSISLEEVDSANFVNSLLNGYDVAMLRPHAPGYPVYVFLGWLLDLIVNNPHLSLTMLSAILGSLSVVPLFLILKDHTSTRMATMGSLLFLANPLLWSFSEAALSDVPSMFFLLVLAWSSLRARTSAPAFILTCVMCSLAIGLRQANIFSLIFVAFPVAYRLISEREVPWKLTGAGAAVLVATTVAWFLPMVYLGSDGFQDYWAALDKQWTEVVRVSAINHVEAPGLLNAIIRIERFGTGYLLSHSWLGSSSNDLVSILMLAPWVFGFGLFVMAFQLKRSDHVLLALWAGSIVYTIMAIHFLPRYGLAHFPAFLIACLIGYQFLATQLATGKLRLEALAFLSLGCVLLIVAVKMQPPIAVFEVTPPPGSLPSLLLAVAGITCVLTSRYLQSSERVLWMPVPKSPGGKYPWRWVQPEPLIVVSLMLLAIPVAVQGYSLASIAHRNENPIQQMVESVKETYSGQVTPCWDSQTHSFFELSDPGMIPVGYWSVDELYDAYRAGSTLLVTDQCNRFEDIDAKIGLTPAGQFSGGSPLWAKTPALTLYATASPAEGPFGVASVVSPVAAYVELRSEESDPLPAALVTQENPPDPPTSLAFEEAAAESVEGESTGAGGSASVISMASGGGGAESEGSKVTEPGGPDPSMSLASRGAASATEERDIQRLITVEPLTDGRGSNEVQFFGIPTFILLSGLAVLVAISLYQVIRTW